jgi:hypothetical protein
MLQKELSLIKGQICWAVLAGPPNGSFIHLHFGGMIERDRPIPNKNLPYGLDRFKGEYHLGIYCEWRLQKNGKPITGSREPNELDGPMVKGLSRLIGKSIISVAITDDCGDLEIAFEDMCLKVFCNYTGNVHEEYYSQSELNWFLHSRGERFIEVKQGCKIVTY